MKRFAIGPGAASLILIITVLAMSTLGLLSLVSARNDLKLSERSAEAAGEIRALDVLCEEKLAELDGYLARCASAPDDAEYLSALSGFLPQDLTVKDRNISFSIDNGSGRVLQCTVRIEPLGTKRRFTVIRRTLSADIE